ncbi:RNA polymerase sigma factor [Lysobacter sp. N42]|jgi:RNA polymerase sigma-70 factor (ECF subfamily)|uniref:RNA polymerase sigma factor n=1 Tax=Lysobacter sp. N42 TaxID=2545719 RepID=UPI001FB58485|nr:RNA polymerase sigma factor [Lysobacter sp. N42]
MSLMPPDTALAPPAARPAPAVRSSFAVDVPEAVLARARSGEHAAFEQIYRCFERPVYTLALRLCGQPDDAADVLQDTMLKVFAGLRGFRGGSPFWGWLRQVAVNEALMRLRRRRQLDAELPIDGAFGAQDFEDLAPPPSAAADAAALTRALLKLPPATRTVLWLHHAEGFTHEEIADLMQRSTSFSKSQLARGGRRLRALLETPEEARRG